MGTGTTYRKIGALILSMSKKQKSNYSELLQDPRWQKKRVDILQRDNFTCQHCGSTEKSLQVHHLRYQKWKKPWEYDNDELLTLCCDCHEKETEENNFLYATFCDLKAMFGQVGLSKTALNACFQRIAIFLGHFISEFSEGGYDGYETDCIENSIRDSLHIWNFFTNSSAVLTI